MCLVSVTTNVLVHQSAIIFTLDGNNQYNAHQSGTIFTLDANNQYIGIILIISI